LSTNIKKEHCDAPFLLNKNSKKA